MTSSQDPSAGDPSARPSAPLTSPAAGELHVVAIGNALVDVLSQQDDAFLDQFELTKGSMQLVDDARAIELYEALDVTVEAAGGSAANTVAGVASFGGSAGFIGQVRDDRLGDSFAADMEQIGVRFEVPNTTDGPGSGRSLIVITPDAQRTMNTSLGAATTLFPEVIDADFVASAQVLYCEGYIWDIDISKSSIRLAIQAARDAGRKVSFTLSDSFCVERHHAEWQDLLDNEIDILFGNVAELVTLTGLDDFDAGIEAIRGRCELAFVTRGPEGSVVVTSDDTIEIPAISLGPIVDTTGAGDQYAAGVLFGLTSGLDLRTAGHLGSLAAAEVITHVGARPLVSLRELAETSGLL